MTKVTQKQTNKNVHSHNSTIEFLESYLPFDYTAKAMDICKKRKIKASENVIRNVKTNRTKSRLDVLNVLTEIAQENKGLNESIKEATNQN